MKKRVLMITVLLSVATSSWAVKLVEFGVKAGATMPTQTTVGSTVNSFKIDQNSKFGYHLGFQSRINLLAFHIQPEIIYNSTRYEMSVSGGALNIKDTKVTTHNIDVPVMLGMKFLFLRANAGPVFGVLTDTKVSKNDGLTEVKFVRPSVGYGLGVGADISKLTLDVRFQGQIKRTEETVLPDGSESMTFKSRNNAVLFSVGFMF